MKEELSLEEMVEMHKKAVEDEECCEYSKCLLNKITKEMQYFCIAEMKLCPDPKDYKSCPYYHYHGPRWKNKYIKDKEEDDGKD